jgi:small redox-active disulfide protein 2
MYEKMAQSEYILSRKKAERLWRISQGGERMKIEILGTGCQRCKNLEANVRIALEKTGKKAEIVKVADIQDILSYGIMGTPALVINGKIMAQGRVPSVDEIVKMLG